MVNPVSVTNSQNYNPATQVDEQRQQQSQPAAKAAKDASAESAAKIANQKLPNNPTPAASQANVTRSQIESPPKASQEQKPNTYSSIDVRA